MLPDELLNIVKTYIGLVWLDDSSEKKLTLMIKNSIQYLNGKSGTENDYLVEGRAQSLLLTRVNYEWCNTLHEFESNYRTEIIAFINSSKVKKHGNIQ